MNSVRSVVSPQTTFILFFPSTFETFFDWIFFLAGEKERQLLLIQATRLEKNRRLGMTRLLIICRLRVGLEGAQGHVSASFVQSDPESAQQKGTIHVCPQGSYWELLSCRRSLSALLHAITLHFSLNQLKDVTKACNVSEAILSPLCPWRDFSI